MRTVYEAIAQIQHMFARYGFIACPLSNAQIMALYGDYSDDEIYSIGCDIASGFTMEQARAALVSE